MRPEDERRLAERLLAARDGDGDLDGAPYRQPIRHYTCARRLDDEINRLFRRRRLAVGLSGDVASPGSYLEVDVAGTSVLVVRGAAGELRAFLNRCRHRGAPLVCGRGDTGAAFVCPYHGWVYGLDGGLRACSRPAAFAGIDFAALGLQSVGVAEEHGIIFVRLASEGDDGAGLVGAAADLRSFELATLVPFAHESRERRINWKLVVDTFLEGYHVPHLHRRSLAPYFAGGLALFDAFGDGGRLAVARASLADLDGIVPAERRVVPHTTLLYLLFPGTVLIHQQDHVELVRATPIAGHSDRARVDLALYTRGAMRDPSEQRRWQRNWEILRTVTEEDFELAERMQAGFAAGDTGELIFGSNESGLRHFHASIARALDDEAPAARR